MRAPTALLSLAFFACGQPNVELDNPDDTVTESAAISGSFDSDRITTLLSMGASTLPLLFRKPSISANGWDAGVSAATTGNAMSFVVDGDNYKSTLLANIAGAQRSIWINVFEWQSEGTATAIAHALIAAATRGVSVHVVVDNRGSSHDFDASPVPSHALMREMTNAGIEVCAVTYSGFRVNHRKLFVFDGTTAMVMGGNIGGNYLLPLADGWTYHDAGIMLTGPAVADVAAVFLDSYTRAGGSRGLVAPARLAPVTGAYSSATVAMLSHSAGADRNIEREMIERIDAARSRVVMVNGFGMSHDIRDALIRAAKRGIYVGWLWGKASKDTALMAQQSFAKLRRAGVDLRRYEKPLHMKAYIFDDTLIIGSANLDGFSCWLNDESAFAITGGSVADDFYSQHLYHDLDTSPVITGNVQSAASLRDHAIGTVLESIID